MAHEYEKTLHINVILDGDNVDQLDVYRLFSEIEEVEITHIHTNLYVKKSPPKEKIDKQNKK